MTSLTDPYGDAYDEGGALFTYAYRAGAIDQADNWALRAAYELRTPLVYLRAMAPGQYLVIAPMFVTADDPRARAVLLEPGLPVQDMQSGGLVSLQHVRAYATREARLRLHQQRFKLDVMRAYQHRCAICALRERALVQAAHIVPDVDPSFYPAPAAWTATSNGRRHWEQQMCNIIAHEWGHLLGHGHADDAHDLMAPVFPLAVAACRPAVAPQDAPAAVKVAGKTKKRKRSGTRASRGGNTRTGRPAARRSSQASSVSATGPIA